MTRRPGRALLVETGVRCGGGTAAEGGERTYHRKVYAMTEVVVFRAGSERGCLRAKDAVDVSARLDNRATMANNAA